MTNVNESTAMVTAAQDETVINSVEGYINTLPMDMDGRMKTINAYNSSVSLKNYTDTVLNICDCITMPGVRKARSLDQTDTRCQNTYLIDTDGVSYFSQSDGVAKSINVIAAMFPKFGKSMEQGCLQLVCKEQVLDNGNTLKSIDVIPW